MAATLTAGQASESKQVEPLMSAVRIGRRRRPRRLAGDKGYSYGFVRRHLWQRGIKPIIPRRSNQVGKRGRPAKFDRRRYRRRNTIERCMNWMKENRRLGTRYDKLACSFMAFVHLAMIRRCFRVLKL